MRPLFTQDRVAASVGAFLDGLLGAERRKTGWMRAEAADDPGPWRQQAVLERGRWDEDALRDVVRDYALEKLADPDAVLLLEETGFPKPGNASCSVHRQYNGSVRKITNCQVGVSATYGSRHRHVFIDRALYLPQTWTSNPAQLAAAYVPKGTTFATKPELPLAMIERAIAAGVPFSWVAAHPIYGVGDIEMALRRAGKGYVLGVKNDRPFQFWAGKPVVVGTAETIADGLAPSAWTRLSAGDGTKRARLYDWASCELPDLDGAAYDQTGLWTQELVIRRSLSDGERAYFTTWCSASTPIQTLVGVEGRRWSIEDAFETAKTELGLAHCENRSWHGWHRHVSLVMMAFALLAVIRHHTIAPPSKAEPGRDGEPTDPLVGEGDPSHRGAIGAAAHSARSRVTACSLWRAAHQAAARPISNNDHRTPNGGSSAGSPAVRTRKTQM